MPEHNVPTSPSASGQDNYQPAEALLLLARNGFDGFPLDDHVPHMDDDSDWNHRGRIGVH